MMGENFKLLDILRDVEKNLREDEEYGESFESFTLYN